MTKPQARERKGYALKVQKGLVPHRYDQSSRGFQQGAWRWWSQNMTDAERAIIARRETASHYADRVRHRFVSGS